MPFFAVRRSRGEPWKRDRRARWGIALQAVAYSLLWQNRFWDRPLDPWRIPASICFLVGACALSWAAARALGRQWRFDAGLNKDHELVTWGPYRVVRHPIYLSMLCLLIGTGLLVTPWPVLVLSLILFITGIEIRSRNEDRLLVEHFGERFQRYRHRVRAYIPFIR